MHPQLAAVVDELSALGLPSSRSLPLAEGRENFRRLFTPLQLHTDVEQTSDVTIEGPEGLIPARLYRPASTPPVGILVYFHGGGWVFGDIESHDPLCRLLANASDCAVLSVGYRLAPEAKFPRPLDDCVAAVHWAATHAQELGVESTRIAVGGDSAGGNLAASTALSLAQRGHSPLSFQLLVFPNTDATMSSASMHEYADDPFLSRDEVDWCWRQYLEAETDRRHPLVSPLHAADLGGLPPALVVTAEMDPLRDEGEAYAHSMEAAGVPVKCRRYERMVHGFVVMTARLDDARRAVAETGATLRDALSR